eukprot:5465592-Amphidinium_carterae.1
MADHDGSSHNMHCMDASAKHHSEWCEIKTKHKCHNTVETKASILTRQLMLRVMLATTEIKQQGDASRSGETLGSNLLVQQLKRKASTAFSFFHTRRKSFSGGYRRCTVQPISSASRCFLAPRGPLNHNATTSFALCTSQQCRHNDNNCDKLMLV